jgi:hypothetical protein
MSPRFFGQKRLQRELGAGVRLLRFPETVNERFAASCRRCPRRAVAVESNASSRSSYLFRSAMCWLLEANEHGSIRVRAETQFLDLIDRQ